MKCYCCCLYQCVNDGYHVFLITVQERENLHGIKNNDMKKPLAKGDFDDKWVAQLSLSHQSLVFATVAVDREFCSVWSIFQCSFCSLLLFLVFVLILTTSPVSHCWYVDRLVQCWLSLQASFPLATVFKLFLPLRWNEHLHMHVNF